jgi:hypothetical protein
VNAKTAIDGLSGPGRDAAAHPVDPHRPSNVAKLLLPEVCEGNIELAGGIFLHAGGDADPTGFGHAFEPGRDVDPIAKDVPVLYDDVPDIDPDAPFDASFGRNVGVAACHAGLHLGRAAQRIDNARKLDQEAVAGGFDYPAAMLGNLAINQIHADRLEAA